MFDTKGKHGCIKLLKSELLPGIIFQTDQGQTEDNLMSVAAYFNLAGVLSENQVSGIFAEYIDVFLALATGDWDLLVGERRQVAADSMANWIMRHREREVDVLFLIIIVSTALFNQPLPQKKIR